MPSQNSEFGSSAKPEPDAALTVFRFSLSMGDRSSSTHPLAPAIVSRVPTKPSLISDGWSPLTFTPNGPNSARPVFESSCSKYEPNCNFGSARYSISSIVALPVTEHVEQRELGGGRSLLLVSCGVIGDGEG